MVKDYTIIGIGIFLKASKNKDYRERAYARISTLVNFLQMNSLVSRTMLENVKEIPEDFRIRRSDLTEEGYAFTKAALDKWLRSQDRGKPPDDTAILEKELKKIRS